MKSMLGKTLGQYQIIEQIGKGGMATVYKAYQPALDRQVAVKILPEYYAHEADFATRFTREAQAIARLDHPNILPVYDFGKQEDISYIVMKYVSAGTLRDQLGSPLPPVRAAALIEQIAGALDAAHEQGILHRDIKPGNVLIDERDWLYLSDFGLAKIVEGSVKLTGAGVGVGTPAYMSPEQGQGLPVDARTDVYALGIILFEMLTGRVPYEADTPLATVIKHINNPLPLPRQLNPDIPETVEQVLLKALAKDREHRFASAGEMATALRKAVEALPPVAPAALPPDPEATVFHSSQPPPSTPLSQPPAGQPAGAPVSPPAETGKTSRLPVIAAVAGLVIGGLIVAVASLIYFSGGEPAPPPAPQSIAEISTTAAPAEPPAPTDSPPLTATATETPPPSPTPIPTPTPSTASQEQDTVSPPPSNPPPAMPPPGEPASETGLFIEGFEDYDVETLESDFVINHNAGNEGRVRPAEAPHVDQGRQALALEFDILNEPPNHYIGFDREFPPQDWSSHQALCMWVESDGSNRSLVVQFGESKFKFWKDVALLAKLGSGDVCVPLQGDHQINLRSIGYYGVYVEGPPPGRSVIYLDNVRVVDHPPSPPPSPTPPPLPPTPAPPTWPDTNMRPHGRFAEIWTALGAEQSLLGYPIAGPARDRLCARENFERGYMIWVDQPQDPDFVWAAVMPDLAATSGNKSYEFTDTWPGGPEYWCSEAEARAPLGPKRGFGMLWCTYDDLRADIGQARDEETGGPDHPRCETQLFQGGAIVHNPLDAAYWVFLDNDGWRRFGE